MQYFTDILKRYLDDSGSDKDRDHNYSVAYEKFLDNRDVKNMLEIGIANVVPEKSSLWAWKSIFPEAHIYGIDVVPGKMIESDRITTSVVDQSSLDQLTKFKDSTGVKFDIILDDGSHVFDHAWLTFSVLFESISDGGIYLIEDIHKQAGTWQQSVSEWTDSLDKIEGISYSVIDCIPEKNDDSVVIGIWKNV